MITTAALALSVIVASAGAPPDAASLMRENDKRHRMASEIQKMTLTLQEKGGPERVRALNITRAQDPADKIGDRQWLMFEAPGDVKGVQLLTIEGTDGSTEQWLYLPAFKKTRRIGSAELGDRFASTDFSYEDLKRRRVDDYAYTMGGSETIDGADCWKIEAVPSSEKAKKESTYGSSTIWLRKDNLFIVKMRHTDRQGRPFKEVKNENLVKTEGAAWRANKIVIIDVQRNHRTTAVVNGREMPKALPPDTFNSHSMTER